MVVSLSPDRSILWDQISYSGNPVDFVWVLPVPSASAAVAIADSKFFDEIDFLTAPVVQPRTPPAPACFGCCSSSAAFDAQAGGGDDVIVYNEAVVGPYETVTIGSQDANALQDWLAEHNYRVAESTIPTIMHYVAQGAVFVVLRLAPGQGVQSMQPVRVSYPGYMSTFPLKMVKVGASGILELSLWVVAEQRYEAYNYENARVDAQDVVWDWNTSSSNYDQAFEQAIDSRGGRVWVTEFADSMNQLWFANPAELAPIQEDIPFPYVTRMRTRMLVEHLDEDLILVPAADPAGVPRTILAGEEIDRPFGDSDDDGCTVHRNPRAHAITLALIALATWWGWRRPRRSRRSLRRL
jgi:hypothetical protein